MTDQLAAEVDRWLAAEVRTTWPGRSGDCCDTAERADMATWFAAQLTAFDAWRAAERRNEANSTQTPENPNRSTQGDVVSVLLEAAELAKGTRAFESDTDTTFWWVNEDGGVWQHWTDVLAGMGSPKPGTHESDLCDQGVLCCRMCAEDRQYIQPMTAGEHTEFQRAHHWSLNA